MLKELKNKIKIKMIKWLELDAFKKEYNQYIYKNGKDLYELDRNIRWLKEQDIVNKRKDNLNQEQIDILNRTLQSVVSIGTDITRNNYDKNRSWAVVCIEGKYNIVKFIDMQGQDYRYILDFLKQFECSRRVIDSPCNQMFKDNFVWFDDNKK